LSSQTTDTPGTTTTNIQSRIAPEQLFKLTRVRTTLQINVSATHKPSDPPHPNPERTKRRPDPVLKFRGLAASGSQLSAGLPLGDLENNTPTQPPPQLHPPHPHHHPKTPPPQPKTTHHTPHQEPRPRKPALCRASPQHQQPTSAAGQAAGMAPRHRQPSVKRKKGRQPHGCRPFFKPLASGVLNYQEDFVMPGSSPR
jgi:hypothetical protein